MSRSSARASVRPSFALDPHGIDERDFTALRTLAVTGMFDAVSCRNVLIYFAERIAPVGFLFLGHAETLTGLRARMSAQASERGGT